ncbi:1-phosphofructokinase family hexose kinase [Saccharopolyspora spinosporotrichia]|uniref:1-phosphofructokinase family hexose kinase n=1 Tax=Saccharopolyspora erythraea TaxID=1836 RepID=A0ABP3P6Y6_SACER|nr:tagatose-6-phosphate kinase [Saccharopolyspora erythraea D]QRK89087.1 1-phosphofructokinase family hexose kinase [Saccharopolyspora erythraea]
MILTVTPNPAWDVTYHVGSVVPGGTHRVRAVAERAGGKGVNVARILHSLGHDVLVSAPAGGVHGELIRDDLTASGLGHAIIPIRGESRRTVTAVATDDGEATLFNEPGPELGTGEWAAFAAHVVDHGSRASAAVFSGSLPRNIDPHSYTALLEQVHAPSIVDASGHTLESALAARPDIVKPNADELAELTGCRDPLAGAVALIERGARAVVASLGPDGLLAVTGDTAYRAVPGERVRGNPTGAGDSVVAALAAGLALHEPWPHRLREAVALSAATVAAPVAGEFDQDSYRRQLAAVHLEEIHAPRHHG